VHSAIFNRRDELQPPMQGGPHPQPERLLVDEDRAGHDQEGDPALVVRRVGEILGKERDLFAIFPTARSRRRTRLMS
jgi:hypothetical protein